MAPTTERGFGKPRVFDTPKKPHYSTETRHLKRQREVEDIAKLEKAVAELDTNVVVGAETPFKTFLDLPLCPATARGLRSSHFETLTDIQSRAIPLALKGRDVLGAAKTGSGKTLAFLVPVLEKLYRARWSEYDGLGALIIAPTRELAVQIFEVLRKIGRNHVFSAGLVIGGKSLEEEAARLGKMNILVCTPGRMLQHLDQTARFNVDNLQILVLDEADRILDLGFQSAVDALFEHLPKMRQTLLFSATQSKKLSDLARLSLEDPEYISVHEVASPESLVCTYILVPLPDKISTLYSFIRASVKSKIICFLSSGKQVRYVYEAFKKMQPGIPLLHLHGRQKQPARFQITSRFSSSKYACLFATDVVARGIDFPKVDWVVQVDAPEDVDTYIHRTGRTARYDASGRAVLFVDPSEEKGMLKRLEQKKLEITKVQAKESRKKDITDQLQGLLFQHSDLKYLAQKAFISYARSIYLQKDKGIFQLDKLDLDGYASSLGLLGAPQIKFQEGEDVKKIKNASRALMSSGSEADEFRDDRSTKKKNKDEARTKFQKMAQRTNQDVLSSHYRKLIGQDESEAENSAADEYDFLSVKRVLKDADLDKSGSAAPATGTRVQVGSQSFIVDSHRREKMLKSRKKMLKYREKGTKLVFDEEGNAHPIYELRDEAAFKEEGDAADLRKRFVDVEKGRVKEEDVVDRELAKQKRKEKRLKRKILERGEEGSQREGEMDGGEGDHLSLLRNLSSDDWKGGDEDVDGGRQKPPKKARKWFQRDEDDEHEEDKKRKFITVEHEPETLEDYEALAAGLLND